MREFYSRLPIKPVFKIWTKISIFKILKSLNKKNCDSLGLKKINYRKKVNYRLHSEIPKIAATQKQTTLYILKCQK